MSTGKDSQHRNIKTMDLRNQVVHRSCIISGCNHGAWPSYDTTSTLIKIRKQPRWLQFSPKDLIFIKCTSSIVDEVFCFALPAVTDRREEPGFEKPPGNH